ncbi:MAG TPA: cobyric acid synthase [Candidatus Lokiarchaeia archaeon]|nr:cobyric acid synthase [Candidatus Lokiarchaeia archaeon]
MAAKVLMVQGASSYAGKSLLVTALCRIYARRGVRVVPFKAQNMSNNAAVCADGGEIGRAQALQATAAQVELSVDMNPVLIKPEADARSQVVVLGHAWRTLSARNYYHHKSFLWEKVTGALDRLRAAYDLVIIEGAGSPVELNLREGDIVNMAIALYAQSPVLLVGDIDRGGIFAQLLGTLWLLEPEERALVRGLVVNKFRGDLTLFSDGVRILNDRGGVPVLGVIPYLKDLYLPDEDAVAVEVNRTSNPASLPGVDIAIVSLPHIANTDDFLPLRADPNVRVRHVASVYEFGTPHAVIIPGTKSTIADLTWLRQNGLAATIIDFARHGGAVVGICGGYQMLGEVIEDPDHVESQVKRSLGLDLLPVVTHFLSEKVTFQVKARIQTGEGWLTSLAGQTVEGYEIHMGDTQSRQSWLEITNRGGHPVHITDGATSNGGRIWGCYLHGIFANDNLRNAWLGSLDWSDAGHATSTSDLLDRSLEGLADAVEGALDMELLNKMIWEDQPSD